MVVVVVVVVVVVLDGSGSGSGSSGSGSGSSGSGRGRSGIHTNSPGLSGSLPDTAPISRSPVRVTISPG